MRLVSLISDTWEKARDVIQRDGSYVIRMKKLLSIVVLGALAAIGHAVTVEETANLNVYYPEYTRIDLVCGQIPKASQKDVEFCCEAAFTGELLNDGQTTKMER